MDLWAAGLVGVFALAGAAMGLSGQAARVLAMALATAAGLLLGPWAGAHLPISAPRTVRPVLAALGLGVVVYFFLSFGLRGLLRRTVERRKLGGIDRFLGGLLGAVQGGYLAFVIAMLLPSVNLALGAAGSRLRLHTEGSRLVRFAAEHPLPLGPSGGREEAELRKTLDRFRMLGLPGSG